MKTVEEWLHELPNPYRKKALRHHSFYNKLGKADSLANALVLGFKWTSTSEGGKYWQEVHNMCMEGKFSEAPLKSIKRHKCKEKEVSFIGEVYPNIDKALEIIMYRPFEERKKQIDKQT